MRERLGDRLPTFSEGDKKLLRNSLDFIGLNHYTSRFIAHLPKPAGDYFYQVQEAERIGIHIPQSVFYQRQHVAYFERL